MARAVTAGPLRPPPDARRATVGDVVHVFDPSTYGSTVRGLETTTVCGVPVVLGPAALIGPTDARPVGATVPPWLATPPVTCGACAEAAR